MYKRLITNLKAIQAEEEVKGLQAAIISHNELKFSQRFDKSNQEMSLQKGFKIYIKIHNPLIP